MFEPPQYEKTCKLCKMPFTTRKRRQKYCSTTCQGRSRQRRFSRKLKRLAKLGAQLVAK